MKTENTKYKHQSFDHLAEAAMKTNNIEHQQQTDAKNGQIQTDGRNKINKQYEALLLTCNPFVCVNVVVFSFILSLLVHFILLSHYVKQHQQPQQQQKEKEEKMEKRKELVTTSKS